MHHVLVPDVCDAAGQYLVPMFHQVAIGVIELSQGFKVAGVVQGSRREFMLVRGKDGVHGLSCYMQNQCIGIQQVDESHIVIIGQHSNKRKGLESE